MRDEIKRTLIKTFTWRIIATTTTIVGVYIITKDLSAAINGGLIINLVKSGMYYIHERTWENVNWGRKRFENNKK